MFCQSCGSKVDSNAKFCPNCGAPNKDFQIQKSENTTQEISQSTSIKNEVFLRGYRCAGNLAGDGKYYAFTYYVPLAIFLIGCFLCDTYFGIFLFFLLALILAIAVKKIFKQSILYDSEKKEFIKNSHSHLNFAIQRIKTDNIKTIRLRYVKVSFVYGKGLSDIGKYYVISFDAENTAESLQVWFSKKNNIEEFLPIIDIAIKDSEKEIKIDKKDNLLKFKDFLAETENS